MINVPLFTAIQQQPQQLVVHAQNLVNAPITIAIQAFAVHALKILNALVLLHTVVLVGYAPAAQNIRNVVLAFAALVVFVHLVHQIVTAVHIQDTAQVEIAWHAQVHLIAPVDKSAIVDYARSLKDFNGGLLSLLF